MSPEQAMGQLDRMGPASDVYSLGATLYCILTGHPPLAEIHDVGEVLRRVALGEIPPAALSKPDVPIDARGDLQEGNGRASRRAVTLRPSRWPPTSRAGSRTSPCAGVRESHRPPARPLGTPASHVHSRQRAGPDRGRPRWRSLRPSWSTARRERAEDRRRQAVEIGEIAEARKQEADRQRDALRRLTTRLTLDRGLSLLEHNDRRAGLLWLARSLGGHERPGRPVRATRFAPTWPPGAAR